MAELKKCVACGAVYLARGSAKTCSPECRRDRELARQRAYRAANRDREAARHRAYHDANREQIAARRRKHYEANRLAALARAAAYRMNKRARKRAAEISAAYDAITPYLHLREKPS